LSVAFCSTGAGATCREGEEIPSRTTQTDLADDRRKRLYDVGTQPFASSRLPSTCAAMRRRA